MISYGSKLFFAKLRDELNLIKKLVRCPSHDVFIYSLVAVEINAHKPICFFFS
jgi:hypothetical protein